MQIFRSMWKDMAVKVAAATTAILAVVICGLTLTARAYPVDPVELPQHLLPGNPLPEDADCEPGSYYVGEWRHCRVLANGIEVELTYDARLRQIVRTDSQFSEQTLGQLILAWGPPTGISRRYRWPIRIQWGSRYVYVYTDQFGPRNSAYAVHYTMEPRAAFPWTGFINIHD